MSTLNGQAVVEEVGVAFVAAISIACLTVLPYYALAQGHRTSLLHDAAHAMHAVLLSRVQYLSLRARRGLPGPWHSMEGQ